MFGQKLSRFLSSDVAAYWALCGLYAVTCMHDWRISILCIFNPRTDHPFTNISTMDDLWEWLQHDMIDALYWQRWYNGEPVQEEMVCIHLGSIDCFIY